MAIRNLPRITAYPGRKTGKRRCGKVLDEVWVEEQNAEEGNYRKLIQLIKWDDGEEFVRFCYYFKEHASDDKGYRYGSQNTMQLPRHLAKALVKKATEKGIL